MRPAFGRHLAEILARRGLSHRRFAVLIGTGQGFVSQVIRGTRTPPLDRLAAWMTALGLDPAEGALLREEALLAHAPAELAVLITDLRHALTEAQKRLDALDGHGPNAMADGPGTTPPRSAKKQAPAAVDQTSA